MGHIISIFRDLNSEYQNMEMHYLHLYFRYENRELLECDFCPKIFIYKDRVKNRDVNSASPSLKIHYSNI